MDCGANANVVNDRFVNQIGNRFELDHNSVAINGVAKVQENNQTGFVHDMKFGSSLHVPQYSVVSNASLGYGLNASKNEVAGLLGMPFLEQLHFVINYKMKKIYFL